MIKSDILLHNSIKTSPHKLCGVKYEILCQMIHEKHATYIHGNII